ILTAIGNDYGFDQVFARQVAALGQAGDVLIAFSTSGESDNVVVAAEMARMCQIPVIGVTAEAPSRLQRLADVTIRVPATDTATAQELHLIASHLICEVVEDELCTMPIRVVESSSAGEVVP
ncbi:MAG TPA: SIS domain-containing protein, partial [Thermomicrobiaceae bacterium]|nr:SIS domain-containing protein [Thermomicrobiaceae bacterium]